ncbi:helix-turn-helix domain-containing protein [Celeribacter sp. SCSIO 80788]|uniref:helix-turn-helix domain-containing protein n=1 Tax=Celeribacter sp. SCSIO 80788 TaxID=3117013 RepID=UPI003DA24679
MLSFMPDSHIPVKPIYACGALDDSRHEAQNRHMKNLKALRQKKGLSQVQLAEAAGCNQATIAKIERGTANPTLHVIEGIAAALKVSPAVLFGIPELQQRAIVVLESLPPDKREAALLVLESMASRQD